MSRRRALAFVLALVAGAPVLAQTAEPHKLRIGTTSAPPFAMHSPTGGWEGISIDLLAEVAQREGFTYDLEEVGSADLIREVASGQLDGAIAAIVPTANDERLVDFTNSYFQSGLGVAISSTQPVPVVDMLEALASREFRGVLGVLLGLTVVFGVTIWAVEQRRNAQFEPAPGRGMFTGFWWATVTMTTVGYGDKTPITLAGRLIATVWMILTLGLVTLATAQLTAILTADRLNGRVDTVADLVRLRVGVVDGAPAAARLRAMGARVVAFPTLAAGLTGLGQDLVDAFVHDEAELAWQRQTIGGITLAPVRFEPAGFAMALPERSTLREPINRALLDTVGSSEWLSTLRYYLGPD